MAQTDLVRQAFGELAPAYEQTMDREIRGFLGISYEEFVKRLVEMVRAGQGDWVLDVATGTGRIPIKLAAQDAIECRTVGLDITPDMLKQARSNSTAADASLRIRLVCASGLSMPFLKGVFDVVVCGFGTHHMNVPRLLAEMARVLKVGGRLVLVEVSAPAFWRSFWVRTLLGLGLSGYTLVRRRARHRAEVEAFGNIRTAEEWRADLAKAGFAESKIVEWRGRRLWYPRACVVEAVSAGV
jgi:ubiquinone/menaquinone biosynthesis C-methylase UbiE